MSSTGDLLALCCAAASHSLMLCPDVIGSRGGGGGVSVELMGGEGSKISSCLVEDISLPHLWNYRNFLGLAEASAVAKKEAPTAFLLPTKLLHISQIFHLCPGAVEGTNKKPPALRYLSAFHFLRGREALLKYAATLKWRVPLTKLLSLMSLSPNPSMIRLLPTASLK